MKIAFFGTSDRTVPILNSLKNSFSLELCITKKDTFVGRKKSIRQTAVKNWAKKNTITFLEISSIKKDQDLIISKLKEFDIKLGVIADFSFIISEDIINFFESGLINIHFSLLPKLRGASPVQHAILNGDRVTGITFFLMDKGMDTGDILEQIEYKIPLNSNSVDLYNQLFELASVKLPLVLQKYTSGSLKPTKQDHNHATYCYSKTKPKTTLIYKEDAQIDWKEPTIQILRVVRAFNPWPVAWTTLGELQNNEKLVNRIVLRDASKAHLKVKIHEAHLVENRVGISKLQIEGKKITNWKSFKNGYLEN